MIQKKGNIPEDEMYRTFNMGVGMVLLVRSNAAPKIRTALARFNLPSWIIGKVIKGKKRVQIK